MTKRGVHDLGGLPGNPIDCHEHTPTLTERRIDAMMMIMRDKKFWVTDENRRTIESMAKGDYERTSYYAKWCFAMRSLVVEKGLLSAAEIDAKLAEVRARYGGDAGRSKPTPKKAGSAKRTKAGAKTTPTAVAKSAANSAAKSMPKTAAKSAAKAPAARAKRKAKASP